MNNRRFGAILMLLGLLFITAAFFLYGYNRNQERKAGEASVSALEEVANLLMTPNTLEREEVVLEDQELPPENTLAAPGSMPSYVSERQITDQQESASQQETVDQQEFASQQETVDQQESAGEQGTGLQQNMEPQPSTERSPAVFPDSKKVPDATVGQDASEEIEENETMPKGESSSESPKNTEEGSAVVEPTAGEKTPVTGSVSNVTAPTAKPSSPSGNKNSASTTQENTVPTEETVPEKSLPDYLLHPEIEMPEKMINGYAYIGTLEIPKLSLSLPIMSSWSYTQLNYAPCRYSGSAYMDDFVLVAHNYTTHFGRIKELRPGDEVIFTDMSGNVLRYEVVETEILERDEVKKLVESGYALTLMTCTIGGRSRVTVRCDRVLE